MGQFSLLFVVFAGSQLSSNLVQSGFEPTAQRIPYELGEQRQLRILLDNLLLQSSHFYANFAIFFSKLGYRLLQRGDILDKFPRTTRRHPVRPKAFVVAGRFSH
jgi:hypothetical protein